MEDQKIQTMGKQWCHCFERDFLSTKRLLTGVTRASACEEAAALFVVEEGGPPQRLSALLAVRLMPHYCTLYCSLFCLQDFTSFFVLDANDVIVQS